MALRIDLDIEGAAIPGAYIRITSLSADTESDPSNNLIGTFKVWASRAAYLAGKQPLRQIMITTAWDNTPVPALYAALKAHPEFALAVEVT